MDAEFRYSLTRQCLRRGELSLSPRLAQIFPDEGSVLLLDTVTGDELALQVAEPRRITGLADYFERHGLRVNDSLLLRPLPDGGIALTPQPSPSSRRKADERVDAARVEGTDEGATFIGEHYSGQYDHELSGHQERLEEPGRGARVSSRGEPESSPPLERRGEVRGPEVQVEGDWLSESWQADAERRSGWEEIVQPEGRSAADRAASLNSRQPPPDLAGVDRARRFFTRYGYRVEGLPHGMLVAVGEFGRREHTLLVRVLAAGDRVDWAELMTERRERGATYAAVVGDHRDLHRLAGPARLAGATLWSWHGLQRAEDLADLIAIGPFELEVQMRSGGLFEEGLQAFEERVGERVEERGRLSAVIARLAQLPAPVFVLDDIVGGELERHQVAHVLEALTHAPFQLLQRIDSGEYCLRQSVGAGLNALGEYARSLAENVGSSPSQGAESTPPGGGGRRVAGGVRRR